MNLEPLTITVETQGAVKANADLLKAKQSADALADSAKKLKTDMTSAFGPSLTNNDVFGPIVPGAKAATVATKELGVAVGGTNSVLKDFRDSMRVARPVLSELGGSMGLIGPLAGAARAGIAGLGAAIVGTLVVSMENAAEKIDVLRTRLQALAGTGGDALFTRLQAAADSARVPLSALSGAFETLVFAQQKADRESGVVYGNITAGSKNLEGALLTIASAVRMGGGLSSDVAKISDTFATSLAKNKGLTADLFNQLVRDAPTVANAIAKAFGSTSVADFAVRLGDTTKPIGEVLQKLAAFQAAQEKLTATKETTLKQAWDDLTTSVGKAWEAMGNVGLAAQLEKITKLIDDARKGTIDWYTALKEADSQFQSDLIAKWSNDLLTAIKDIYSYLKNTSAWDMFKNAAQVSFDAIVGWANSALSVISSLITAIRNMPSSPGAVGGGPAPAGGGNAAAGGEVNNPYGGGNGAAGGSGYVIGGSAADMAGGTEFAGATGGQFQVHGTGGTDSQRISFRATPGEMVTVTPPPGTNQVSSTGFAGGGQFTVPNTTSVSGSQVGGNIDSVLTTPSQALVSTIRKMTDELNGLGIDEEGVKSTISGAGNNKLPDVIRLTGIQTTTAITQSADRIIQTIMTGDINITAAINALSTTITTTAAAATAAAATTSSSGSPNSAASGGGGGGISGIGKDTTLTNAAQQKLWESLYGGLYKDQPPGGAVGGGARPQTSTPSAAVVGTAGAVAPGKSLSDMERSMQAAYTAAAAAGYPDVSAFGGSVVGGSVADMGGGTDFAGAGGGEFDVPSGFDNDSFKMRVQSGERVKVTPKELNKPNSPDGASGSGGVRPINVSVTIVAKDPSSFDNSKAQLTNTLRVSLNEALRHV